ncbi:uncharacterized protein LOC143632138 [Bidens hawaiensis]|uniref:uncharacterized protein LOC143632138 n=1 Tax=Bidens hawaiensis TaxID=980011 RepID=UPI00404A27FA
MEALTGIMKKITSVGLYEGIACGVSGPVLTHLLYADDVVFVGEFDTGNALVLRRILRCFYLVSGLKINLNKSWVYGVKVGEHKKLELATVLKCQLGEFPFKYLGLQVGGNMHRLEA